MVAKYVPMSILGIYIYIADWGDCATLGKNTVLNCSMLERLTHYHAAKVVSISGNTSTKAFLARLSNTLHIS